LARPTENGPISVCTSASASTVADDASHATSNLPRAFLALHLANHTVHPDLNGVHATTIYAIHFDAAKFQCLMNASQVRHVSGNSVGGF
jgi:hypothetical protein